MESNNADSDAGDKCNLNGDCSKTELKRPLDFNHAKNIDDIATPSELKFDQGTVNNLLKGFQNILLFSYLHTKYYDFYEKP